MKTPLPNAWVDKIFKKLSLVYGRDFASRWEGLDVAEVKADWAHELAGFEANPKTIAHALQNLPPAKPPTVLEFRALAIKCPTEAVPAIQAPPADPEKIAEQLLAMEPTRKRPMVDSKGWARRIIGRHKAGDRIKLYSLMCAKKALGIAL